MRTERIDFSTYSELSDTRYIYNSGGDVVRAKQRENKSYTWQSSQAFITTSDVGNEYEDNPEGLRSFDAGHLTLSPPPVSNTKKVFHIQSNNSQAIDTSENKSTIIFGSNNVSSSSALLSHPAGSVSNILSFQPPKFSDGIFRNLVGIDQTESQIAADDKDFVIGGFYSAKHRRDMLGYLNSLSQGPSGRKFYLNDRKIRPDHVADITEINTLVDAASGETQTIDALINQSGVSPANLQYINSITYTIESPGQVTNEQLASTQDDVNDIKFIDMITYVVPGSEDTVSQYDVWSDDSMNTNNLSAATNYSVDDDDYNSTVVPLITANFSSLTI